MAIAINKISTGISTFYEKKSMKITGGILFDYIGKSKLDVSDEILDKIEDSKTLKNQHPTVLEFFSKHFNNVKVANATSKQKVMEIVQSVHKKHHLPFNALSYKSIAQSAKKMGGKMGDLNLFKKPISDWDEPHYESILKSFFAKGEAHEKV